VADSSEDEVPESPATPRRKKISVGMPIHPPEGEITNLKAPVNRRVEEVKGIVYMLVSKKNVLELSPC